MTINKSFKLECRYFTWRLRLRSGVWQADSRGNNNLKGRRHSLGTRDFDEAKKLVHMLDEQMAVDFGLIQFRQQSESNEFNLTIEEGIAIYETHLARPRAAKGPKESTRKRYGRIIRAFVKFLRSKRVQFWEQVNKSLLNEYATERSKLYKTRSVATEITLVLCILKYLVEEKKLDQRCSFKYEVVRAKDSDRYCPTVEELKAILEKLKEHPNQLWLYRTVAMLAHTGLRLSEIAQLTTFDVDLKKELIYVRDESEMEGSEKTTKTGYSRVVPMHLVVKAILQKLVRDGIDRKLFVGPRGGKLSSDIFGNHLRLKALTPLSERFPHPRFKTITAHSLRHFFSSLCASSGVSEQTTKDWMGHRTSNMSRYYFHRDDDASRRIIKKIESLTDVPAEDVPTSQDDESKLRGEDSSNKSNEVPPKGVDGTITNPEDHDKGTDAEDVE